MAHTVRVIAGAPCSGKSTLVERLAEAGDLIVDWDLLMAALSGAPQHARQTPLVPYVAEARDAVIGRLQQPRRRDAPIRAWIVTTDATNAELYRWAPWHVTVLTTPREISEERARADRPNEWLSGIEDWWERWERRGGRPVPQNVTTIVPKTE